MKIPITILREDIRQIIIYSDIVIMEVIVLVDP